jgi:hypothetical protein
VPVDCLSAAAVLPLELVLRIAAMLPSNEPRWKKYFASLQSDCQFAPPASESQLIDVEQALGCGLPMLLREFLLEADGAGVSRYNFPIIWSSAEIQKQNQEFRTYAGFRELYMPFDHLLFFAADGGGDQFAYAIQADGKIHAHEVFRWEHETDARSWYASSLWQFLEKQLKTDVVHGS